MEHKVKLRISSFTRDQKSDGFEREIATSINLRNLGSSCPSLGPNSISFAYNETKLNNYVPFRLAKVEM